MKVAHGEVTQITVIKQILGEQILGPFAFEAGQNASMRHGNSEQMVYMPL